MKKLVSLNLIKEQCYEIVKTVTSMKNRLCLAHEIIKMLSKDSDRLSKAFIHFGRLVKTQYILRYITDKGEHRHYLLMWIFFANQATFTIRNYGAVMNKASCLSLVSNTVLY